MDSLFYSIQTKSVTSTSSTRSNSHWNNKCSYSIRFIDNIGSLSENIKFICTSFRNNGKKILRRAYRESFHSVSSTCTTYYFCFLKIHIWFIYTLTSCKLTQFQLTNYQKKKFYGESTSVDVLWPVFIVVSST